MTRLELIERWAFRIAMVSTLIGAARFGWALTQLNAKREPAVEAREFGPRQGSAGPDLSSLITPPTSGLRMPSPEAIQSAIAAAVGSPTPMSSSESGIARARPDIISSYLSVNAGPARSELRVNGALVGRTPFLGQISCERGQTVRLDVLPPQGLPNHYEIPCLPGEMRLRDDP